MFIKRIEVFGFKSFKNKTVLEFDPHEIVGIVGPNGCGKSNILEALLWVMGENSPKQLRGETLSDVIFGGTLKEPLGHLAEVVLTLNKGNGNFPENYKDFSEIMIGRRLFRDGNNECFINQKKCLLKDIREFFMNTGAGHRGFSMIEQESIEKLIAAKPLQRRVIIEEVAGITKFKSRKHETQRKLDMVRQNLKRVDDILKVQEVQLNKLAEQAKKATKYKKLKENIEIKNKEITQRDKEYLFHKYRELNKEQRILRKKWNRAKEQILDLDHQIQEENTKLETIKQELETIKQEEKKCQWEESQFLHIMNVLEGIEAQKKSLQNQEADIHKEFSKLQMAFQQTIDYDKEEKKIRAYLEKIRQRKADISSDVSALQMQIQFIEKEKAKGLDEKSGIQNQIQKNINRKNKLKILLEKQNQMRLKFNKETQNLLSGERNLKSKKAVLDKDIQNLNQEIFALQYKIHEMKKLMSFFETKNAGTMAVKKRNPKAFQFLFKNLEIESDYKTVVNLIFGQRIHALVAKDDLYVETAADYLKGHSKGKSWFLSSLPGVTVSLNLKPEVRENIKTYPAFVGFLSDKVKCNVHTRFLRSFLEQIVIVSHLKAAFDLKKQFPAFHFVTPKGDMITRDSFVYTGSDLIDHDMDFLQPFHQIDKLTRKLSSKKLDLKVKTIEMAACIKQLSEMEKQSVEVQTRNTQNFKAKISLKEDIEQMTRELIKLSEDRKKIDQKIKTLDKQKQNLFHHSEAYIQELQDLEQDLSLQESHLQGLQQKIKWDKKLMENKRKQQGLNQNAGMLLTLSSKSKILEQGFVKDSKEERQNSLVSKEDVENIMKPHVSIKKIMSQFYQEKQKLLQKTATLSKAKVEKNQIHRKRKHNIEEKEKLLVQERLSGNDLHLSLEKKDLEKTYLKNRFLESYQSSIEDYIPSPTSLENRSLEQLKQTKSHYEKQLDNIKEVNFLALEEYEKLSKENFSFNSQKEDLVHSKKALMKLISHIDNICETRFADILGDINNRFARVFSIVFPGDKTKAQLILHKETDSEDCGVDIVIHPPGKKPQSVTLLSRGEKALTSICLIYSLFLVKPSPFCVIDEADAPLDDANIFRFLSILQEMSKKSQLIVITHNKHTMQICKKLYGVTLNGPGLSQIVSVDKNHSLLPSLNS